MNGGVLRWAATLNLTMHLAVLAMSPILVAAGALRPHAAGEIAFAVAAGAALAALQLRHVRAATRDGHPPAWPLTLALQAALVYAPLPWLGPDWSSTQLPLSASLMLLLPRRWGPVAGFAVPYAAGGIVFGYQMSRTLSRRDTVLELVYYAISFAVFAVVLYGTARLVSLVVDLYRGRAELAELAVDEERVRVSRDLHDLLGQSLSAISLKGDLAAELLAVDPSRARREIASLADLARATLRDVRAVTRDEHHVTLREELVAAQGLLAAAGVETRVESGGGELGLSDDAQQVLAWAIREGTTNLLRHSDAATCTITLARSGGTVALEMSNDGVRRPRSADGSGLAGLRERAARAGGRAAGELSADGRFRLRVELPSRAALADLA